MSHIVPVTEGLLSAMKAASSTSRGASWMVDGRTRYLRDRSDFPEVARALEHLTKQVLIASSTLSLLSDEPRGARFGYNAASDLARHVSHTVDYLRETAAPLMKSEMARDAHKGDAAIEALDLLNKLYGLLLEGILSQTRVDLKRIAEDGVAGLVLAADAIANGLPKPKD